MSSPPIKPVRFYKIGGFKQADQDPFRGQNLNPFQFGFGNPYPYVMYQPNQRQSLTPSSRNSDSFSLSNTPTNPKTPTQNQNQKNTKSKPNNNVKEELINESEDEGVDSQLETIEEENVIVPKVFTQEKIIEDKPKVEEIKNVQEVKPRLNRTKSLKEVNTDENKNQIEPKSKVEETKRELIPKKIDSSEKDNLKMKIHDEQKENKKEIVEQFEKIDKNLIETPRSKDGKLFSIRGTTKTVIEVTTTEIVDESLFATRESSSPTKIVKLSKKPEDKPKSLEKVNAEIQTDEETQTNEIISPRKEEILPVKKPKIEAEKVDKETETDYIEPKVIVEEKTESIEEKPLIKKKKKKKSEDNVGFDPIVPIIEQKEETDDELKAKNNSRSRKDLTPTVINSIKENRTKSLDQPEKIDSKIDTKHDFFAARKRPSQSLDERKKVALKCIQTKCD